MSSLNSNSTVDDTALYQYTPSEPLAQTFLTLFALTTFAQIIFATFYKTPFFIPMIIGGIMETGSYYGRIWSHRYPYNTGAYVLYSLLTLAAAPFLAGTNYMTLSQIMTSLHATHISPISVRSLTAAFVIVDVIVFVALTSGVGLQVTEDGTLTRIGSIIVITGLALQTACLSFFGYVVAIFQGQYTRSLTMEEKYNSFGNWAKYLWPMYIACAALVMRNVFRICQYAQGRRGMTARYEWFTYVFDATPLWLMMVMYMVAHPGQLTRKMKRAILVVDDASVVAITPRHSFRPNTPA